MNVAFVHLPNLIVATFMDSDTRTSETHFVRAGGRVALTKLHKVHLVIRDVLHDKIGATEGSEQLKKILQEKPLYTIWIRCFLAFLCASPEHALELRTDLEAAGHTALHAHGPVPGARIVG